MSVFLVCAVHCECLCVWCNIYIYSSLIKTGSSSSMYFAVFMHLRHGLRKAMFMQPNPNMCTLHLKYR